MQNKIIPQKLISGDHIRVISPSRSSSIISKTNFDIANERIVKEFGTLITFGEHIYEKDIFNSSSIVSRIYDLHKAFTDKNVKIILTMIGGFNSNQLLKYIDWDLIKNNPKIICGYSDITVLANAIFAKTGLITYLGPHFSTFGQKEYLDYTIKYFKKCLMNGDEYLIKPSEQWLDDPWYKSQEDREIIKNEGYWVIQSGFASGNTIGGNMSSFSLLLGTEYIPSFENSILFLELDNYTQGVDILEFDRHLQSILQQKGSDGIKGIIVGRFQRNSNVTREELDYIFKTKKELEDIPIIANVDFGHTNPMITFPIGGYCEIKLNSDTDFEIKITEH
jgi:muramoyltetrapeptide carboxypeptidase